MIIEPEDGYLKTVPSWLLKRLFIVFAIILGGAGGAIAQDERLFWSEGKDGTRSVLVSTILMKALEACLVETGKEGKGLDYFRSVDIVSHKESTIVGIVLIVPLAETALGDYYCTVDLDRMAINELRRRTAGFRD